MPNFSNLIQRPYSWTVWKTFHASKYLTHQYEDDGVVYTIWGYDGSEVIVCTIWKGTVPDGVINSGYSQSQNDSDKSDFETNYKNNANKSLVQKASFSVMANDVSTGNNKSMFSLCNGAAGASFIKIHEIWLQNGQTALSVGVVTSFEVRRINTHSGGTLLNIGRHDTNDVADVSVTARTGATVAGESPNSLDRWLVSNDEWVPGTLDLESFAATMALHFPVWRAEPPVRPLILRDGQGIHIKCATNTTVGLFDITVVFTQENVA